MRGSPSVVMMKFLLPDSVAGRVRDREGAVAVGAFAECVEGDDVVAGIGGVGRTGAAPPVADGAGLGGREGVGGSGVVRVGGNGGDYCERGCRGVVFGLGIGFSVFASSKQQGKRSTLI